MSEITVLDLGLDAAIYVYSGRYSLKMIRPHAQSLSTKMI